MKVGNQEVHDETSLASSETTPPSPSHVVSFSPSEKTKKAIQILQDLFSKDFSLLMHPGRSIVMKDTLKYLLTLSQNEGFCMITKSEIQSMLQCFKRWSLEYHNASNLSKNAEKELSKASEVMNGHEVNAKEFYEMVKEEKCLCNKLVRLEERKRKLEEEIEIVNIEIAKSTEKRVEIGRGKLRLHVKGRHVKDKRDDLMIKFPRLKAEQQLAGITRTNIEVEWVKLQQQFRLLIASSFLSP